MEMKFCFRIRHQLQINENKSTLFKRKLNKQLRLGQLAEQFVFNQLEGLT